MISKLQHGPTVAVNKINELVDAVNAADNITGDGMVVVKSSRHGKVIGIALNVLRPKMPKVGGGGSTLHLAYCSEDAPSDNTIAAELDEIDGDAITVYCAIAQGGTALDEASPRLIDTDPMIVTQIGGDWWCTTMFMPTDDCVCVEDTP